ncbi:MAG TPA: type II secretion system F family protein [Candidatus Angelobacter sp.]|jgi:type IV pilus assembly protein PilC|nr:type II secretion system F family protein [Candidatus Angelobacter sp.]
MAEFLVKMADERGNVLEQVDNGFSEQEVRDRYMQQGYLVYSVKGRTGLLTGGLLGRKKHIKTDIFIIFNQQLYTLIKAGLPMLMVLDLLARRQRDPNFKSLLGNVHERVRSGQLLSEAFEAQQVVPKVYTTSILAGERSGNLLEVLNRYISYQRITSTFRKKLISSLWYPALLFLALTVMLSFLFTYVVPQFASLYSDMNASLPDITKLLLAFGTTVRGYFFIIVPALIMLVLAAVIWSRSAKGGETLDKLRFKVPLFGSMWLKYQVALFSRTLATLLSGGLPLVPSLETARNAISSRKVSGLIETAGSRVREGRSLSSSLEETGFFPDMAVEMIEVGESTGALDAMLNSVAEFYEEDVQNGMTAAMQLVEPIILIFMAIIIAIVLIALYLPIFSLGGQLSGG